MMRRAKDPVFLTPDWPAPDRVRAAVSTRLGGVSGGAYTGFNLGAHVGDDPSAVADNRALLARHLGLSQAPCWLEQVHGVDVVELEAAVGATPTADASVGRTADHVCAVLTADCLPVLLTDERGSVVAAAHAGWRGLAAGVLENTVQAMQGAPEQLMAWLGPAIGPDAFEVGAEVRAAFVSDDAGCRGCFREARRPGHFLADIFGLARRRLARAGVSGVYGGGLCTASDETRFFSYRRDATCGRMASLIWLAD
jgi:YfiH family protein